MKGEGIVERQGGDGWKSQILPSVRPKCDFTRGIQSNCSKLRGETADSHPYSVSKPIMARKEEFEASPSGYVFLIFTNY